MRGNAYFADRKLKIQKRTYSTCKKFIAFSFPKANFVKMKRV